MKGGRVGGGGMQGGRMGRGWGAARVRVMTTVLLLFSDLLYDLQKRTSHLFSKFTGQTEPLICTGVGRQRFALVPL